MSPHADSLAGPISSSRGRKGRQALDGVGIQSSSCGRLLKGKKRQMRLPRAGCWMGVDGRPNLISAGLKLNSEVLFSADPVRSSSIAICWLDGSEACNFDGESTMPVRDGDGGAIYARVQSRIACPGGDALAYLGNLAGSLLSSSWSRVVETYPTARTVGPQDRVG